MKNLNFTGAYAEAGYTLDNPRNQWSATRDDPPGVAITVWSDEIDKSAEPWTYNLFAHPRLEVWISKVGNSVRKRHIQSGLDVCGGRFDLILCKAVDVHANPRKVEWARHWHQRYGLISPAEFNPETGEFLMRLISADDS